MLMIECREWWWEWFWLTDGWYAWSTWLYVLAMFISRLSMLLGCMALHCICWLITFAAVAYSLVHFVWLCNPLVCPTIAPTWALWKTKKIAGVLAYTVPALTWFHLARLYCMVESNGSWILHLRWGVQKNAWIDNNPPHHSRGKKYPVCVCVCELQKWIPRPT